MKKNFEILKTPLNPACKDEQIGFFSFFLSPFPDLEKRVGSLNPAYFSRELLFKYDRLQRKLIYQQFRRGEEKVSRFDDVQLSPNNNNRVVYNVDVFVITF